MQSSSKYNHHDLAVLSDKVYDKSDSELLTVSETDCLVRKKGNTVVLAFRGTEASRAWPIQWNSEGLSNSRDIVKDLRFIPWKEPVSCEWVHRGFGKGAYSWFNRFCDELDKSKHYIVTGHSLGAAIAPMVARMMKLHGFIVDEVVVFGEPKGHYFGSAKAYQWLGIPTTSYRHSKDWIRLAGVGSTCVPATLIELDESCAKSHGIGVYAESLKARTVAGG